MVAGYIALSIQSLNKKALENWFFQLSARSFFLEKYWKIVFSAFGKILVLANAFIENLI